MDEAYRVISPAIDRFIRSDVYKRQEGCFCTVAVAFACIDCGTSKTAADKLRELLVTGIHIESCKVGPEFSFPQSEDVYKRQGLSGFTQCDC